MKEKDLSPKDPHDRFFKTVMSDALNIKQFIEEFLPKELSAEISLNNMKMLPTEKVRRYTKYHMDLAVECNIGDTKAQVYFIFEHKSYPDTGVLLQMLGYMYATWDEQKKENLPLTPIIPVVIYHGGQEWNIPTNFQGQFESLKETIKPYMPEFKYALIDLSLLSDEEIRQKAKGNAFLAASLELMKYVPRQDVSSIMGITDIILLPERDKLTLFWYMIYALDVEEETMQEIVEKLGGEQVMPSLAERLIKRGKMEGKLEGKLEGKIEGKQTTLIKQLRRKFGLTPWEEEKIRSINDEAKLDAALEAILDAKSKSEVLKILES